jgi:putative PIN family toxin of toxin-antitoxin system
MRVVLDANVIVSRFLVPRGKSAQIIDHWSGEAFELLLSESILVEIHKVLRYPRLSKKHRLNDLEIDKVIAQLRSLAILVTPQQVLRVVFDDPADGKFVACAVRGGAEFLVTRDQYLLILGSYSGIQILPPALFLAHLESLLTES